MISNKRSNLDLLMAGVRSCTGHCVYCSSANQGDMWRGSIIEETANKTYDEVIFDFDKLENALKKHMSSNKYWNINIWGADPISSFYALQDSIDFLKYFANKYDKDFIYSSSTNGTPIGNDDIVNFLVENKINVQLSHDGVAEELRLPIDPLKEYTENFKRLNRVFVNCVAHYYNCDFKKNIEYFSQFPFISDKRFSRPMIGKNYSNTINKKGFRNGSYYEHLKGTPFGDFGIRNTEDDPHLIQDYVRWAFSILPHIPGWRFNIGVRNSNPYNKEHTGCGAYALGLKDHNFHIDTLGNYTVCNLADSLGNLGNPDIKPQFDECKKCRYKLSSVCTDCALNEPECTIHDKCEFNYALNVALEISRNYLKTNKMRGKQNA